MFERCAPCGRSARIRRGDACDGVPSLPERAADWPQRGENTARRTSGSPTRGGPKRPPGARRRRSSGAQRRPSPIGCTRARRDIADEAVSGQSVASSKIASLPCVATKSQVRATSARCSASRARAASCATGRPVQPACRTRWRDHLASSTTSGSCALHARPAGRRCVTSRVVNGASTTCASRSIASRSSATP